MQFSHSLKGFVFAELYCLISAYSVFHAVCLSTSMPDCVYN